MNYLVNYRTAQKKIENKVTDDELPTYLKSW